MAGPDRARRNIAHAHANYYIQQAFQAVGHRPKLASAFDRLFVQVQARSTLLKPDFGGGDMRWMHVQRYVAAIMGFAVWHEAHRRDVEDWRPPTGGRRRQFASLVRHLFERYPVPAFMNNVWLENGVRGAEGVTHKEWYMQLTLGVSPRELDLPLAYTRRMGHFFLQAPDHYPVTHALRYGQVLGLGGDRVLLEAVLRTDLRHQFANEPFWEHVIRFFINHPEMPRERFGDVYEFLQHHKFSGEAIVIVDGQPQRRPPEADFSLKGRTAASLLRLVDEWRTMRAKRRRRDRYRWLPAGIPEFRLVEHNQLTDESRQWLIQELLSCEQLWQEGRAMRNCVGTYARRCAYSECSIWSMKLIKNGRPKHMLTIEVDRRHREITTALAKANTKPSQTARRVLAMWAEQAKLTVAT